MREKQFLAGGLPLRPHVAWSLSSDIPEVDSSLVQSLGQRLLPWMDRLSLEHLNPSIYVGLRLSSLEASTKEALYLHSLKVDYQQSLLRYCHALSSLPPPAPPSVLLHILRDGRPACWFGPVTDRLGDLRHVSPPLHLFPSVEWNWFD